MIESSGPYPIQSIVASSRLHPELKDQLRPAFFTTNEDEGTRRVLRRFGPSRFVAVSREDYSLDAYKDLAALLAAR